MLTSRVAISSVRLPQTACRGNARAHTRRKASPVKASVIKPTLYDMPVSNNGARNRLIIYWKGLEDKFDIKSPAELGGLKSDEYLALNPQGKMPLLCLPSGVNLPESEVISQYICHAYAGEGPSLIPQDPEMRAIASLATRIHDTYIVSIQGAMYRGPMDIADRADKIAEIAKQLDVLEGILEVRAAPFVAGDAPTFADAALFPTFVFMEFILPRHFGWADVFAGRPKLKAWWAAMCADTQCARVKDEVGSALQAWEDGGRFTKVGVEEHVKDTSYKWAF